jgi:hypothetical protein
MHRAMPWGIHRARHQSMQSRGQAPCTEKNTVKIKATRRASDMTAGNNLPGLLLRWRSGSHVVSPPILWKSSVQINGPEHLPL